jgi:hypothetical protein
MLGDYGQVVVMDWGLALYLQPDANHPLLEGLDLPEKFRRGQGTPAYMAPEQRESHDQGLGVTTDIYQLGGILFRILTGYPPHPNRANSPDEWSGANGLNRLENLVGVPEELLDLTRHCLQADPAQRPNSAEQVAARIQDWLGGRSRREKAAELLQDARAMRMSATGDFESLARTQAAYEQALASWPDHPTIRAEYDSLLQELICAALAHGDLRYARTLLFHVGDRKLLHELTVEHGQAVNSSRAREQQRAWALALAIFFAMMTFSVLVGLVVYRDTVRRNDIVQDFHSRSWSGCAGVGRGVAWVGASRSGGTVSSR